MKAYDDDGIWIDGNMPSSKNGKTWTGKFLVSSKVTQKYIKHSKNCYIRNTDKFLKLIQGKPFPLRIGFQFVRGSKHKFDYVNPCQTVLDLMVDYGWLADDNCDEILPVFIPYDYDAETPGVFITVL